MNICESRAIVRAEDEDVNERRKRTGWTCCWKAVLYWTLAAKKKILKGITDPGILGVGRKYTCIHPDSPNLPPDTCFTSSSSRLALVRFLILYFIFHISFIPVFVTRHSSYVAASVEHYNRFVASRSGSFIQFPTRYK